MGVQLYKPTLEVLQEQAELARQQEEERKQNSGGSQFSWGNIKEGDNLIRALPPTNSRGRLGRRVAKHFFTNSPFSRSIKPSVCVTASFPESAGAVCPICEVGDKLLAQYPQLKINAWHSPGPYEYIQAIDKQDPENALRAKIYQLTPSVYNWLVMEQENLLKQGVDMTELTAGIDIKITKVIEKFYKDGKERKKTKYEKTLWSPMGANPIAATQQEIDTIVASMISLDDVWKFPGDDRIAEMHKHASDIYSHYVKQQYSEPGVTVQVPGTYAAPAQQAPVAVPAPAQQAPVAAPAPAQQAPVAVQASPTDKPACFGGASPRSTHPQFDASTSEDGVGYSEMAEVCLICSHEMACIDACAKRG